MPVISVLIFPFKTMRYFFLDNKGINSYKYVLLSHILKKTITTEDLSYTPQGKPYLKTQEFYFNVSHSKTHYAFVWTKAIMEIGIDIEDKDRQLKPSLIEKILNEEELKQKNKSVDMNLYALKIWTVKEAIIKAQSESIITHHRKINILLGEDQNSGCYQNLEGEWQFQCFEYLNQLGTIAIPALKDQVISTRFFTFEEFFNKNF